MKVINIKEDYGLTDLDNKSKIIELLDKLDINQSNEIELNFSDVIIAYPGASKILDKVFELIHKLNGAKKITIKTDFHQNEEELYNAIFWGSEFLNIEVYERSKPHEIKGIVKNKLQHFEASLSIEIYNQKDEMIKCYDF